MTTGVNSANPFTSFKTRHAPWHFQPLTWPPTSGVPRSPTQSVRLVLNQACCCCNCWDCWMLSKDPGLSADCGSIHQEIRHQASFTIFSIIRCCCCHDCCNHRWPTRSDHSRILRPGNGFVSVSAGFLSNATTSNFKWPSANQLCTHKWRVCKCLRHPPILFVLQHFSQPHCHCRFDLAHRSSNLGSVIGFPSLCTLLATKRSIQLLRSIMQQASANMTCVATSVCLFSRSLQSCSFFRANLRPNQSPHALATSLLTFVAHTSTRSSYSSPGIDLTSWVLACAHSVAPSCVSWDTSPLQQCQLCLEQHTPISSLSCGTKSTLLMWASRNSQPVLFALHFSWHVANRHLLHQSTSWLSMHLQQVSCRPPTSSHHSAYQFWLFDSRSSAPSCHLHQIQSDPFVSPRIVSKESFQTF